MTTKPRIPTFTTCVTVDVDVDIDPDDLIEAGWVYKGAGEDVVTDSELDRMEMLDAVRSLHRQAHPKQALDPVLCHEEPCRHLSIYQLTDR